VRRVAQVLGVSRSQLSQRLKESGKSRSSYRKPEDDDLLVEVRALVDERPTYGYRRITALLNRARRKAVSARSSAACLSDLRSAGVCRFSTDGERHVEARRTCPADQ